MIINFGVVCMFPDVGVWIWPLQCLSRRQRVLLSEQHEECHPHHEPCHPWLQHKVRCLGKSRAVRVACLVRARHSAFLYFLVRHWCLGFHLLHASWLSVAITTVLWVQAVIVGDYYKETFTS